jgi:hypothetical protein
MIFIVYVKNPRTNKQKLVDVIIIHFYKNVLIIVKNILNKTYQFLKRINTATVNNKENYNQNQNIVVIYQL